MSFHEAAARPQLLHGIQAIRGLFAVVVVCHHVAVQSERYWGHRWFGGAFNHSTFRVDFFFVLSGFVLWAAHKAFAGRPGEWLEFLTKRILRLYPLLIVLTLVKALLLFLVPERGLDTYSLLPSLLALPQDAFPVIVAAWTLSFEMCFVVVMAACLALPRHLGLPGLLAWGLLLPLGGFLLGIRPGLSGIGFLTHPFILQFAVGALAAEAVGRHRSLGWGAFFCTFAATGLVLGAVGYFWVMVFPEIIQKCFWAVVFASGLAGLALWERSVNLLSWRLKDVLGLGRASYSIFLSHSIVLMGFFSLVRPGHVQGSPAWMDLLLALLVVVAVLFGLGIWKWLETPLVRWCAGTFSHLRPAVHSRRSGGVLISDNPGTSRIISLASSNPGTSRSISLATACPGTSRSIAVSNRGTGACGMGGSKTHQLH